MRNKLKDSNTVDINLFSYTLAHVTIGPLICEAIFSRCLAEISPSCSLAHDYCLGFLICLPSVLDQGTTNDESNLKVHIL